jgi:putative membrane protein
VIDYPTRNWLGLLLRLRGTVLPRVLGRSTWCAVIGVVAAYLKERHAIDLSVPVLIHTMVGVVLGLLLVFRTNASYDRYWEGRKLVGAMVNTCRDVARQTAAFVADQQERRRAAGYVIALYACIRRYLRHEREWPELEPWLTSDERAELARRRAGPLLVSRWLSELYARENDASRLSHTRLRLLDANLTELIRLWGGAERIIKTPVPFAYAHHIKLFLTLFCFTIPFALLPIMGWYSALGAGVVAIGMFGIDEIGVEIEDPFGYDPNDLPLDAIGETIAVDVLETAEPEAEVGRTFDAPPSPP